MYYKTIQPTENTKQITKTFLGYNHRPVIEDGEFYDTKNLTCDKWPLMSPRKKRIIELNIADEDWVTSEIEVTATSDITHKVATYKCSIEEAKDEMEYQLVYKMDVEEIASCNARIEYISKEGNIINFETIKDMSDTEIIITFVTPKLTDSVRITIDAVAIDTLEEEELDTYLYDFVTRVHEGKVRGILIKHNRLVYMIGTKVYYKDECLDFTPFIEEAEHTSEQQLINFGTYILIFPLGIYFNTLDLSEMGKLGEEVVIDNATLNIQVCDKEGKALSPIISDTEPADPTDGQYWISTKESNKGLYVYVDSMRMWQPVLTTYLKVQVSDTKGVNLSDHFKEGDAVFLNTWLEDINNGSLVQSAGADYLIVIGFTDKPETKTLDSFVIERRVPPLDYVCVCHNRVWGCYATENTNEIYACKQGDPKNWYVYEGIASDSYALTIASDGAFTGAISFNDYPFFFKENVIYEVLGNYPSAYQLYTFDMRGVQKGSSNSLAVVGEYLLYKSNRDICVFDGNSPVSISQNLGYDEYSQAAAGSCVDKYYISMHNDTLKKWEMFVYDMEKQMWMKEDDTHIQQFIYVNSGELYGCNGHRIYGFENAADNLSQETSTTEEYVEWEGVTGAYGYEDAFGNYISRLNIRAEIPYKSEIQVLISYDDGEFIPLKTLRGEEHTQKQTVSFIPKRCDHYNIKLKGHGDVLVYSITRHFEKGSDH